MAGDQQKSHAQIKLLGEEQRCSKSSRGREVHSSFYREWGGEGSGVSRQVRSRNFIIEGSVGW